MLLDGRKAIKRRLTEFSAPHSEFLQFVVLEESDHPVAWAHLRFRGAGQAYLAELFVWPGYRGHGLGAAIVRWCKGEAISRGVRGITVMQSEADAIHSKVVERSRR